jgi:type I restriction enzyme R subunit
MSRRIAAELYQEIILLRPDWHNEDLKKALSFYADSGGKGDPLLQQEQAVVLMQEKLEVVSQMFHGFSYEEYFTAETGRKLYLILAAEVIEELIKLSKEIQNMDKEPKEMGLSDYEYAFYTAIANNDSAGELMEKDKLRELAVVLYQKVKENASIDWTIKESVKAKLKVIVKRILRQFGYPPDMQILATETVLKQAELIAEELLNR